MSTDNVTPIRAGSGEPPLGQKTKSRRPRRKPPGLTLSESREYGGFTTHDVLNGLHGVCEALNTGYFDNDVEISSELHIAAKVLAAMLQSRVQS